MYARLEVCGSVTNPASNGIPDALPIAAQAVIAVFRGKLLIVREQTGNVSQQHRKVFVPGRSQSQLTVALEG
jgi:hypothetical protein